MKNYLHRRPVIRPGAKKNAGFIRNKNFWGGLIFALLILVVLVLPGTIMSRWGQAWQFWGNVVIRWGFAVAAFGGAVFATRLTVPRKRLPGLAIGLVLMLLFGGFADQAKVGTSLSSLLILIGGGTLGGILWSGRERRLYPRTKPRRSRVSLDRRNRPV